MQYVNAKGFILKTTHPAKGMAPIGLFRGAF